MSDIKIKWLLYTVAIALVPFIVRFLLNRSLATPITILTIPDLVAYSLVMQVSTIGAAETLHVRHHKFKTICYGSSIILLIISGLYYGLSIFTEKYPTIVDTDSCIYVLLAICIVSTLFSYATQDKSYKDTLIQGSAPTCIL